MEPACLNVVGLVALALHIVEPVALHVVEIAALNDVATTAVLSAVGPTALIVRLL